MEKGLLGVLDLLRTYVKLAEQREAIDIKELRQAYYSLRPYVLSKESLELVDSQLHEAFAGEPHLKLDLALALDTFIHKVHAHNSDILGEAFDCDRDLAADIAIPILDAIAKKEYGNPVRKQVRGYDAPELVDGLLFFKSDDSVIIAGYASVEMVDREKHLIPREVLATAFKDFMAREGRKNVQFSHSNVQVGEVLESWQSPNTGKVYKSGVDDRGLFVVARVWPDTTVGKRVCAEIQKGTLRAFSISGLAKGVFPKNGYKEVKGLELYEITVCESPMNPGSFFSIVKGRAASVEQVVEALKSVIPLDWTVKVDGDVQLPFGYKEPWLERMLKLRLGSPAEPCEYALVLSPYLGTSEGIPVSDYSVAVAGEGVQKSLSFEPKLLIRHSDSSPLAIAIYRAIKKLLPSHLKDAVGFQFAGTDYPSSCQPVLRLVLRPVEASMVD